MKYLAEQLRKDLFYCGLFKTNYLTLENQNIPGIWSIDDKEITKNNCRTTLRRYFWKFEAPYEFDDTHYCVAINIKKCR